MSISVQLAFGLARLAAVARQETWRAGEVEGLTPTQAEALDLLARRPEGIRLSALAAHLNVTQPTASDAVSALVRKKLAAKRADPADRRAVLLQLTDDGRRVTSRWPSSFSTVVDAMTDHDRQLLLPAVMRTISALALAGAIPPQRMCLSCSHFARDLHPGSDRPHHCRFIDEPLGNGDLLVDCPDHRERQAA